jgi:hypothetical protein
MASNAPIVGVGHDVSSERKKNGPDDIEPAPPAYSPDGEMKDASEEINYHTLTWWYVHTLQQ